MTSGQRQLQVPGKLYDAMQKRDIAPSADLVVHPLAQQLNRRLGKVLLPLRHIQVINKDDISLPSWRTKHTLQTKACSLEIPIQAHHWS